MKATAAVVCYTAKTKSELLRLNVSADVLLYIIFSLYVAAFTSLHEFGAL